MAFCHSPVELIWKPRNIEYITGDVSFMTQIKKVLTHANPPFSFQSIIMKSLELQICHIILSRCFFSSSLNSFPFLNSNYCHLWWFNDLPINYYFFQITAFHQKRSLVIEYIHFFICWTTIVWNERDKLK